MILNSNDDGTFQLVMDWMLFFVYSIVTLAFLPLFASIITLLKLGQPQIYEKMRVKATVIFSIFILFFLTRLYLYIDLKSLKILFREPSVYSTIPFYLTEVIIAASISYVLHITN